MSEHPLQELHLMQTSFYFHFIFQARIIIIIIINLIVLPG